MAEHKYILEPYKGMNTRHRCPNCQQRDKTFSLYIDTETGEHIHPSVGRCNRESNCGNHYTPKQYFQDNNISFDTPQPIAYKHKPVTPPLMLVTFIPVEVFKASLNPTAFEKNNFLKYLTELFGAEVTGELISRYFIATSKHWDGATVFWQIDTQGKVRTGKIMLYSPSTGKRIKEPRNYIHWAHKVITEPVFELRQCLFGEHLLIDKSKPLAIVESEKTAIIASVYLPQFIWVAVGSLTNLNAEKCSILKGRTVTLFPDLNGFDKWSSKAKELSHLANFIVSDLLERKANEAEKKQGLDLADYLIRFDLKEFEKDKMLTKLNIQKFINNNTEQLKTNQLIAEAKTIKQPVPLNYCNQTENWEQDISELENYFTGITLPTHSVKLNQCSTVTNISLFIESHFATVKANNGKRTFLPYLNQLQELKQYLILN